MRQIFNLAIFSCLFIYGGEAKAQDTNSYSLGLSIGETNTRNIIEEHFVDDEIDNGYNNFHHYALRLSVNYGDYVPYVDLSWEKYLWDIGFLLALISLGSIVSLIAFIPAILISTFVAILFGPHEYFYYGELGYVLGSKYKDNSGYYAEIGHEAKIYLTTGREKDKYRILFLIVDLGLRYEKFEWQNISDSYGAYEMDNLAKKVGFGFGINLKKAEIAVKASWLPIASGRHKGDGINSYELIINYKN